MSNQNVTVSFRAQGGDLTNYVDSLKSKNKALYDDTVSNINKQNSRVKEQNKLIEQQIALLTKKNQLQLQAERNIIGESKKSDLRRNDDYYETRRNAIIDNHKYTERERTKRLSKNERERRMDASQIREQYGDLISDNRAELSGLSIAQKLQKQKELKNKQLAAEQVQAEREKYGSGNPDFTITSERMENYLSVRKNKGQAMFNNALREGKSQNAEGGAMMRIIEKRIADISKKSKDESEAKHNILQIRQKGLLDSNKTYFSRQRDAVSDDSTLDSVQKAIKLEAISLAEKDREENIKGKYSEGVVSVKEQERQTKLQTSLAQEQINVIKQKATENVKAIQTGDMKLSDVFKNATTDQEKLIAQLTKEGVTAEQKQKGGSSDIMRGFGMMMATGAARDMIGIHNSNMMSQNGFDVLGNNNNMIARIVGGIAGGALAALFTDGLGVMGGAAMGSELAGSWVGGVTEQQKKQALSRQEFYKNLNGYRGVTGDNSDRIFPSASQDDLENVGTSVNQYIQSRTMYARLRGNRGAADNTAIDSIYLNKGYGVDQSTSSSIVEMMRSFKNSNSSLQNFVGGVLEKGKNTYFKDGDTSFLNEFLNKFISLQKQLLNNQTTVATGTTMDLLTRFNKIGGEFGTSDSRSAGLMSTINNAISNPSGDFSKALTMYSIRRDHPEITNPFEMMIQMQKGLAGGNLQSVYKTLSGGNAPRWAKMANLTGMIGLGGQAAFGKDLYGGLEKGIFKGKLDGDELNSTISDLQKRAEGNTAAIERTTAGNENAWLTNKPADEIGKNIATAVQESLNGAVIELQNGKLVLKSHQLVQKENVAQQAKDSADMRSRQMEAKQYLDENNIDGVK